VRVHLVLPRESLYSEQEHQAKAAVILKTHGGRLSEQAQLGIPQLVASAVDGLLPEHVTVVDADSNTPLVRARGPGGGGGYSLDEELAKTVVRTLEPVVGADHVRASVHVEYDTSSSENTEEVYDPKTTTALNQQKSEENMGGAGPAGIPGTASNLPGGAAATSAANRETQSSRSESVTYAVSKSVRHSVQPPGRIRRIAAAVLVDDAVETGEREGAKSASRRKRTPEEMKQIEQLASAALGLDAQRGDVLAIENLSFQETPLETPAKPTAIETTRRLVVEWSGLLRYAGVGALFLIVYFLMLRPVKKQVLAALRELPKRVAQPAKELAAAGGGGAGAAAGVEIELPAGSEGAKRASALKKQLAAKVKDEPAAASRLVQGWIREASTS
jgi:flagellar M-ring protein FliF